MDLFSVISLLGGLTFFLFGMNVMSGSLEKMAGGKLEVKLKSVTSNPVLSIAIGIVITIAMQSSSAVTVMLVGLVSSGIISFADTISIIFGANIGTTFTSWILSLAGLSSDNIFIQMLKPVNFSPIIAFVGIIMIMFCKKDTKKSTGTVFVGFAVLMYGMTMMSDAVAPLADTPMFSELLIKFSNPLLGVLIGLVFTAIVQSSAATIGILQALSLTGAITHGMALPIVMGLNIGTCMTSVISCIGATQEAKRVATVHVAIKIIGTIICLPLYLLFDGIFNFAFTHASATPWTIAVLHTVFNLAITVMLMPFSKYLVKLAEIIIKDKKKKTDEEGVFTLDDRLRQSPSVAISECDNYTVKMAKIAHNVLIDAFAIVNNYDEKKADEILREEDKLDILEDKLGTYLVKLSSEGLSKEDSHKVSKMLHAIGDFERMGDHSVNLLKVSKEMDDKNISFSETAKNELAILTAATEEILAITTEAYEKNDVELARRVEPLEQVIDGLITEIRGNHIKRLQSGNCTIELGFILADTLTNFERVSDHCSNIAVTIIEVVNDSFDTHKYLNAIKYGNDDFDAVYDSFREKYTL